MGIHLAGNRCRSIRLDGSKGKRNRKDHDRDREDCRWRSGVSDSGKWITGRTERDCREVNSIGEGLETALAKSNEKRTAEDRLITNVSHDIKTPLTSIINYVELLKQEDFKDPKIRRYIEVLEQKSQRLKTLTEDVVEASKVSSGNITLEFMNLNLVEMIQQTSGEFEEKFKAGDLEEVMNLPNEEIVIRADGRRLWRVLSNIYNNAAKYAMQGTRVYADLEKKDGMACFSLKNISARPLNIPASELTERFIAGMYQEAQKAVVWDCRSHSR
mgnify:CR=1 FL=1